MVRGTGRRRALPPVPEDALAATSMRTQSSIISTECTKKPIPGVLRYPGRVDDGCESCGLAR